MGAYRSLLAVVVFGLLGLAQGIASAEQERPLCDSTTAPNDGNRILTILVSPTGIEAPTAADVEEARQLLRNMDLAMDRAAGPYRDQDLLWHTTSTGEYTVCTETVDVPKRSDDTYDWTAIKTALRGKGYSYDPNAPQAPRKYHVLVKAGSAQLYNSGRIGSGWAELN